MCGRASEGRHSRGSKQELKSGRQNRWGSEWVMKTSGCRGWREIEKLQRTSMDLWPALGRQCAISSGQTGLIPSGFCFGNQFLCPVPSTSLQAPASVFFCRAALFCLQRLSPDEFWGRSLLLPRPHPSWALSWKSTAVAGTLCILGSRPPVSGAPPPGSCCNCGLCVTQRHRCDPEGDGELAWAHCPGYYGNVITFPCQVCGSSR